MRVQEGHEAVQLAQVVLQRRARQQHRVPAADPGQRHGVERRVILHLVPLVQHHALPLDVAGYRVCQRPVARRQGLTLVQFSAQHKLFVWDRGAFSDCSGGAQRVSGDNKVGFRVGFRVQ
jgi:hypothetical protein